MKFNIRLFATLKKIAGASQLSIEVPEPATVSSLLDMLAQKISAIEPSLASILIAVNHEYAKREQSIQPSDEIALFPPVSGG